MKKKKLKKYLKEAKEIIKDLLDDYEYEKNYYGTQSVADADDFLKKLDGVKNEL